MANTNNMQLRTLYLSSQMDHLLRMLAFRLNISKGELIRRLLDKNLQAVQGTAQTATPEQLLQDLGIQDVTPSEEELVEA